MSHIMSLFWGNREDGGRVKVGKGAIRERRPGNTNHMHHLIQYLMQNSGFITLGIITFDVTLNVTFDVTLNA